MTVTTPRPEDRTTLTGVARRAAALAAELEAELAAMTGARQGTGPHPLRLPIQYLEEATRALERAADWLERESSAGRAPSAAPAVPAPRGSADEGHPLHALVGRWVDAVTDGDLRGAADLVEHWPASLQRREAVRDLFREGTAALEEGRHAAAVPLVRYVGAVLAGQLGSRQRLAAAHVLAGRLELRRGGYERALDELRSAAEHDEDSPLCHAALSECHLARGELIHARDRALRAVELAPEEPEGYVALGACAEAEGDDPSESYARAVGIVWDADDPLRDLSAALAPLPVPLLRVLAERAVADDRGALALVAVRLLLTAQAEEEAQDDPDSWRRKAAVHALRARALALTGAPVAERVAALLEAGQYTAWHDDIEGARQLAEEAIALDPGSADAHYLLTDLLRAASGRPEPPYAEAHGLRLASAEWELATGLRAPDTSWQFRVRATIPELLAQLPEEDEHRRTWEAVGWFERALIADPDDRFAHQSLSHLYGQLDLHAVGLHAVERVLRRVPDEQEVLRQRVVLLANSNRGDEALAASEVIADRAWVEQVRASVLIDRAGPGDLDEALRLLEGAVAGGTVHAWVRANLITAYRLLGRDDDARAAAEALWSRYDPLDRGATFLYGYALLHQERYEEALRLLAPLLDRAPRPHRTRRAVALCRMALGDLTAADDLLDAIRSDPGLAADLSVLLGDLQLLTHAAREGTVPAEVRAVCDRAAGLARQHGTVPPAPPSPEEELRAVLETPSRPAPEVAPAARCALVRLAREREDWAGAVEHWRRLHGTAPADVSAAAARPLLEALSSRAGSALAGGAPADAVQVHALALGIAEATADPEAVARVRAGRAAAGLLAATPALVDEDVRAALDALGTDDPAAAGAELARMTEPVLRSGAQCWTVADAWADLADRAGDERLRTALLAARRELGGFLDRLLDPPAEEPGDPYPPPTLVVELGDGLIPEDTGDRWPLFATGLPRLRDELRADLGFVLPVVRVRGGEGLDADEFSIRVQGAVRATGHVTDAASQQAHVQELREVLGELRTVVTRNIDAVFGLEEFEALLAEAADGEGADVARLLEALPDARARLRCARLLRRLLEEGVGIGTWSTTVLDAAVGSGALATDDVDTAEDRIRPRLRALLPGNQHGVHRFRVPEDRDRELRAADTGEGPILSVVDARRLVGELEAHVAASGGERRCAVVAGGPSSRRALRRLIRTRLPDLAVLAAEETAAPEELPFLPGVPSGAALGDAGPR